MNNNLHFRPSSYSVDYGGDGYGFPLAIAAYFGGRWGISKAAEAYASHLNEKYDFVSVRPEEALEQIGLGENKLWIPATIGFMGPAANRVQKAPTDLVQAYVKTAYLMALAGRYLQNPGLLAAARATLGRVDTLKINTKDTGAIALAVQQGWAAVQAVAGSQVVSDPQLRALSVYFGERPKGGTGLAEMAQGQQSYKLDPQAEGQAVQDALTPTALLTEEGKRKRRQKQRQRQKRARARRQRLVVYGGLGTVAVLGLAILAFKGV